MPIKIPTYQAQETINPLQGGGMRVQAEPQAFGVGLADKMGQVGMQVSQEIVKAQQEANEELAKAAYNQHDLAVTALETEALSQKGENVYKQGEAGDQLLSKAYLKKFQDTTQQIESTLKNDQQKKLFRQAAAQREVRFAGRMGEHEAKEMIGDQITKANMQIDTQMSGLSSDLANGFTTEADLMPRFGGIEDAVQRKAKLTGLPVEAIRKDSFEKANVLVLSSLIKSKQFGQARGWASDHKDYIDPKTFDHFDAIIKEGEAFKLSGDRIGKVMAEGGTESDQEKKLRDMYGEDKDGFQMARAEHRDRWNLADKERVVQEESRLGRLWDMRFPTLKGQKPISLDAIMETQEWLELDGKQRNALRAQWEGYAKRNQREGGSGSDSDRVDRYAKYKELTDDDEKLASMTRDQIKSWQGELGPTLTNKLQDARDRAAADVQSFNHVSWTDVPYRKIMKEFGYKTEGKISKDDEAKVGKFREVVGDVVAIRQKEEKRKLLPEEVSDLAREQLKKVKVSGGWFFGLGSTEKSAFEVATPGVNSDPYYTKAAQWLVDRDITPNEKRLREVAKALRRREGK
jgi:hypothetical protein